MQTSKKTAALLTATLAVLLQGCGDGGGSSPTTPSPTPAPPSTVVITQGSGTLRAGFVGAVRFSTTAAGRLDVTVDWTFASNDLDIAIFTGSCAAQQIVDLLCGVPAGLSETLNKPERLSLAGASAGDYTLAIDHLGARDESISYQMTLTR
jgi:hypothetical protein